MADIPPASPPPPPGGGFPPPPGGGFPPPPPAAGSYPPPPGAGYGYGDPGVVTVQPASFGARLGAILIDGVIASVFSAPAWLVLVTGPKHMVACHVDINGQVDPFGTGIDNGLCEQPTGSTVGLAILLFLVLGVGFWFYNYVYLLGTRGQTIGKKAVSVKVVDATTGASIGAGRAFGRSLAALISGAVCYLGYLWMLWDPKKQTWHDKMLNTLVVSA
jgi:uncharacterized RDD family membrane protein YckC